MDIDSTQHHQETLNLICQELKIVSKQIKVLEVSGIAGPIIIGFIKPIIIIPKVNYNSNDIFYIFKHECVHYKRKDLWIKFLAQFFTAIYWFNPLGYILLKN